MSELFVILTDFAAPAPLEGVVSMRRLALLETLLARARRHPVGGDWRAWLAARYAAPSHRDRAPAETVAAAGTAEARGAGAPLRHWLATPVYFVAGLSSVQLHPIGLLSLDNDEQEQMVLDFARAFAGSPWHLARARGRELLLSGPSLEADGTDPALYLGNDLRAGLPHGADAATLRRLGVEIEMWLHEHALNRARGARDELPVTALWLWGASGHAGSAPVGARPSVLPRLWGRDTYAEALWSLAGALPEPLPEALGSVATLGARDAVLLYSMLHADGLERAFAELEQRWIGPALAALASGSLAALSVLLGSDLYRLTRAGRLRLWRRRKPWWESIA